MRSGSDRHTAARCSCTLAGTVLDHAFVVRYHQFLSHNNCVSIVHCGCCGAWWTLLLRRHGLNLRCSSCSCLNILGQFVCCGACICSALPGWVSVHASSRRTRDMGVSRSSGQQLPVHAFCYSVWAYIPLIGLSCTVRTGLQAAGRPLQPQPFGLAR